MNKKSCLKAVLFWVLVMAFSLFVIWPFVDKGFLIRLPNHFWSNYLQRSLGLSSFIILALQIVIGAFRSALSKRFGQWVLGFHSLQGKFLYALIFSHIISYLFYMFFFTGKVNLFYIFTDFCVLCELRRELYISMGRISFILLNFTILAVVLRHLKPMIGNWIYIHKLNYIIFFMISLHFFFVGSDIKYLPIKLIFYVCNLIVFSTLIFKLVPFARKFRLK